MTCQIDDHVMLKTRTGYVFDVAPATPDDRVPVAEFFRHVSREDLRFRFLTALNGVSATQIASMVDIDHDRTETFIARDTATGLVIACAVLAVDTDRRSAEAALAIRTDFKRRGVSWTLLEHVARTAKARGIGSLRSIESRDHHEAIELEREMGFTARACPGDATLVELTADLSG